MLLTLTKFRNNLFSIADDLEKNNETIIVWKRWEKDMVVLSYGKYIELLDIKENKKKNNWLSKFSWILKDSPLNEMNNKELKEEIDKIRYEEICKKHLN